MDWKVLLTTFGILVLAELGDKTQLAVITMTTQTRKPLAVFLGAVSALALVTFLGVVFGHVIHPSGFGQMFSGRPWPLSLWF
jgi:putative Ca2+/H+ antiporter (TMEM165/GDT1 family)